MMMINEQSGSRCEKVLSPAYSDDVPSKHYLETIL